ncbi:MAG: DNA mismatch repair endonuclease MutL [Bacillota bacterium]
MGIIKLLDEATINKIAAGEVIEKPASIVKELAENSVDAGATAVTIEVADGGKSFICVSDNGCGISDDDIEHVFVRHATSKIDTSDDLFDIHTLGFRGEAMASIASVSDVELKSKSENSTTGHYIHIKGGSIIERKEIGYPTGTSVTVRNLFFNTPARYKFLKSDTSEQGYIVDIVEKLALSNTAISFKLTINGKTVLHTPGNGDLLSVIHCIYGKNAAKSMLLLDYKNDLIEIEGYIGKPEIAKGNSTYMIFSVNNRIIKNRMLIEAVRQAYKTLLMNNKFPFAIINIKMDTDRIDVNVHPTKAEVKFSDDRAVFNTLYIAIKNCLNTSELFFGAEAETASDNTEKSFYRDAEYERKEEYIQQNISENTMYPADKAFIKHDLPFIKESGTEAKDVYVQSFSEVQDLQKSGNKVMSIPETVTNSTKLPSLQVVGQLMRMYVLAQSNDTFYIIDQHAAHERIMYEYLLSKYDNGDIAVQQLLLPIIIELSPKETIILSSSLTVFQRLGFELEWFGENAVAIRSIPIIMGEPCSGEFFSEVLSLLDGETRDIKTAKEKIIISMSCKNAVKAGAALTQEEMTELVSRLSQTKLPYTCPHGRPTIITLSDYELERKFKRIV